MSVVNLFGGVHKYYRDENYGYIVNIGDENNPLCLLNEYDSINHKNILTYIPYSDDFKTISEKHINNSFFSGLHLLPRSNQTTLILSELEDEIILDFIKDPFVRYREILAQFYSIQIDCDEIKFESPSKKILMMDYYADVLNENKFMFSVYRGKKEIDLKLKKMGLPLLLDDYQKQFNINLFGEK